MMASLSWSVAMEQVIWVNDIDPKWAQRSGSVDKRMNKKGTFITFEDRLITITQRNGREIRKQSDIIRHLDKQPAISDPRQRRHFWAGARRGRWGAWWRRPVTCQASAGAVQPIARHAVEFWKIHFAQMDSYWKNYLEIGWACPEESSGIISTRAT